MKAFFQRSASVHYKDTTKVMQVQQVDIKDNSGLETRSKDLLDFNQNTLDVINVFFNFKFAESKEIGSIAITAVVEKIQALKEAIKMNEQIIRGSLSYTKKRMVTTHDRLYIKGIRFSIRIYSPITKYSI